MKKAKNNTNAVILIVIMIAIIIIVFVINFSNNKFISGNYTNTPIPLIIPPERTCNNQCNYTGNTCMTNDIYVCIDNNNDGCTEETYVNSCLSNFRCVNGKCIKYGICGDGICNNNETCSSCTKDCGGCIPQIQP